MSKKHVVNVTLDDFILGRRYGEVNVANFRFVASLLEKPRFLKIFISLLSNVET